MSLYGTVEGYLKNNKTGVVATVISRSGSAPRDTGAKMFIGEDGRLYGTIGGGRLEHSAYQEALTMMGMDHPKMLHIKMDAIEVASQGMICGGNVDVLLEPVLERYGKLYTRLEFLERKGKKAVLITRVDKKSFSKTLLEEDLTISGDALSESDKTMFLKCVSETKPHVTDGVIIEPLHISAVLYIFGAGHVSQFIAKAAKMVGFYVVIIDDRKEFASRERFPDADEIRVEDFQKVFNGLQFAGKEFVVIVTRGHQYDVDVLKETLKRKTRYIGMIGSRRKVKMVFDYMKQCGFDDEHISGVHAPIGLSIHAETPEEIAISIVAELIQVRGEL